MITFDDMEEEDVKKFKQLVDECIILGSNDPEMKEGFAVIDKWATENNIDVYEMFLNLYVADDLKKKMFGDEGNE